MSGEDAGLRRGLIAAALVALSTLGVGFFLDDFFHLLLLGGGGEGLAAGPMDLYRFTDGDPAHMRAMMNRGPYPWWSDPEVRIAFWRPLSSALANLDWRLFGAWAPGHHLHSVAWYLVLVGIVGLLFRRVAPARVASWGLLLFALDEAHAQAVGWIANRNALIAAVPAFLGLIAHLRWREEGWRPGLPLSLLGLTAGLAGGEVAVAVAGYWLAYELVGATGTRRERALGLAPVSALLLGYLLLHGALGYGAEASGTYIDPRTQPLDWLAVAPGHALALAGAMTLNAPTDIWYFFPDARGPLALAGVGGLGLTAVLLRWAWPGLPAPTRRAARWLGLGAVFSVIPTLSVFPMARLLLVPSVGWALVLSAVLVRFRDRRGGEMLTWARLSCGVLVVLHLVSAPLGWLAMGAGMGEVSRTYADAALAAEVDDARLPEQRVYLPAVSDPVVAYYSFVTRSVAGRPLPRSHHVLSIAPYAHRLTRVAEDTIELEVLGGELLTTPLETMFRAPDAPLQEGEVVELEGLDVEVLELGAQGPVRLRVRFPAPLEDPSLVFLSWQEGHLRRLALPGVGESLRLERPDTPFGQL
ncbi:MAG: hypothetical protein H6741_24705 [Alphaproteobacteria bacterium]|nr:hypothetical protein [Alphaproteobacteria bacterium]